MANAAKLIEIKGDAVASLPPTATVLEAARLMNDRHIGSVLVTDRKRLVGIFTERDVLRRIVAEQRDAASGPSWPTRAKCPENASRPSPLAPRKRNAWTKSAKSPQKRNHGASPKERLES